MATTAVTPASPALLSFAQIEQLWTQAGGDTSAAPLMAGIAESESGGNPQALNNNPATGDYSAGLWQINYYGNLYASRAQRYGTPTQVRDNPILNAHAAVDLYAGGKGLSNWQGDNAYKLYQSGGINAVLGAYGNAGGSAGVGGQTGGGSVTGTGVTASPAGGSTLQPAPSLASSLTSDLTGSLKELFIRLAELAVGALLIYLGLKSLPGALRGAPTLRLVA